MPQRSGAPLQDGQRVVVHGLNRVIEARMLLRPYDWKQAGFEYRAPAGKRRRRATAAGYPLALAEEGQRWARGWRSRDANALRALVALS